MTISSTNSLTIDDLDGDGVELSDEQLVAVSGGCRCASKVITFPSGDVSYDKPF